MAAKTRSLLVLLLLAVLGGFAWQVWRGPPEPDYQGKPLSHWLALYDELGPSDDQADAAVRQIGTNAIPTLLRLLKEKDSPLKRKWIALVNKQHLFKGPQEAKYRNFEAGSAFRVLGPTASNAMPELIQIYNQKISIDSQSEVLLSMGYLGPAILQDGTPIFLDGLTNSAADVRFYAAMAIAEIHSQPEVFVPALTNLLKDPDKPVWHQAFWALGAFGRQAKEAVPVLVDLLNDPSVHGSAADALKKIDPEALAKARAR